MPHALTPAEFRTALARSFQLIAARPAQWILVAIVFLVVVESLTFIPFVGFLVKIGAAGLFGAQFMRMFAEVDAGGSPRMRVFARSLELSWSAQWVLVVTSIGPFLIGVFYLAMVGGGWVGIEYFFGHLSKATAPTDADFVVFKIVLSVADTILTFVPPVVVLYGRSGVRAIVVACRAAALNWRILVFLVVVDAAFEVLSAGIFRLPLPVAMVVSIVTLVAYLLWQLAITYACATRVFASGSEVSSPSPVGLRQADLR